MSTHEELHANYIKSTYRREVVRVPILDVSHFKAEQKYVVVYHDGGELLIKTSTLALEQMYGERFIRVHKSTLVARDRLQAFRDERERDREPAVVHLDGVANPIPVARGRIPLVQAAVEQTIAKRAQAGEAL